MGRLKVVAMLLAGLIPGAVGAGVLLRASVPSLVQAAPAPLLPAEHLFLAISKEWRLEASLLKAVEDPPNSYTMVGAKMIHPY